jgi:hypothetical protein
MAQGESHTQDNNLNKFMGLKAANLLTKLKTQSPRDDGGGDSPSHDES